MRLSVEDFQKRLRASGLVTDEAVQKLLATLPTDQAPADGEQLARVLVRAELLTAYQAQQIYAGKGSALVLGNYVIQDKLGQGGMGLVLKAVHRRMHRVVALKVLSPDAIKTAGLVERFHREVRAVAKLEHPHIVTAFDADEDRGVHFFVMQYVAGRDLSSIVKSNGPLPADKAVSYLLQAARGLEYAHKQGIVHRDIKPANLLLTNDGVVKILDMGLARIEDAPGDAPSGKADLTATGAVMGTVDYMSPEQALDTKHADARSDIYSLGCTLFYLLTGQPVYSESTMMKRLLAHREAPIPSVSAMLNPGGATPGLLDALDAILQKMLAKRSQDRYQSMTEVVAALSAVSRGETAEILATHSSSGGVSLGGFSGTSVQTMTAGRTAAVAAGLGESETMAVGAMERTLHTIVTSLSEPLGTRHQHARGTNWLLQIGVPMALSLLLAAGLYFAGVFDVAGKNAGNNTAAVTVPTVVPAAKPAEDDVDAGPWAPGADDDRWLGIVPRPAKLEGVTRWQMETVAPRGRSIDLRWSPDGRRFVLASEDQRLRVYRWDGKAIALDHIIPELDGGQTIRMKWSPDNRWLAWQGDFTQDLRTWDTVAKKYGPVMHTGYRTGPAGWSKDGTVFVAASEDGAGAGVFFWEWPSGQLKHAARGHSATPYLVEWSFDQQWLAATDGIDAVRFWKPDGSPGETARIAGCTGISSLSWNPAQSVLAVLYSTAKPSIEAALLQPTDVSQPVVVPVHPGHHHVYVGPLPWTSDGTSLLIQDSVQNNRFQPYDLTGRPGRPGPAIGMSFWTQRPGTGELFLGYPIGSSAIWDPNAENASATLIPNGVTTAAWSPDGRVLAAASNHGDLIVWDAEQRSVVATQPSGQWMISELEWDRASERLSAAVESTVHQQSPATITTWQADGRQQSRTSLGSGGVNYLGRSNNGQHQWAMSSTELFALDPQTGARTSVPGGLVVSGHRVVHAAGSPVDDRLLLATTFGNGEYQLAIAHTQGGEAKTVPIPEHCYPYVMAWNDQGTRFAVTWMNTKTNQPNTEIWEPSRPSRIAALPEGTNGLGMKFSPDGNRLCLPGGTAAFFYRTDTGAQVAEFGKGHGGNTGSDWSPDSRHMVHCCNRGTHSELEIVGTANDFAYTEDSVSFPMAMSAAWSPDGKLIAASSQHSLLRTWKSRDREWQPAWTSVQLAGDDWATFSAGGKLLSSSDQARRQLFAVVERTDGMMETLPFDEFLAQQTPLPPLKPVDVKVERDMALSLLDREVPITVRVGASDPYVTQRGDLPKEEFVIINVGFAAKHRVDDHLIERLVQCRRLETLYMHGSLVGDDALVSIGKMASLKHLTLSGLPIVKPSALRHLDQLTRLETLTVGLEIDNEALAGIARAPRLTSLNLLGISGEPDLSILAAAPQLNQLTLSSAHLETQPPAVWSRFAALRYLQFHYPTPRAVEIAAQLPQLETLDLYGNGNSVTPDVLAAAARVRNVRQINILSESPLPLSAWLALRKEVPDSIHMVTQQQVIPTGLPELPPRKGLEFDGVSSYVHIPSLQFDAQMPLTLEVTVIADPVRTAGVQWIAYFDQPRLGFQIYQNQQHSDPNPPSSLGIQFQAGERNLMAQTHPASWSELLLRRTELAGVWTGDKLAFFVNGRTAPLSGPYQPNVQMDSLKGFVIGSHVHGNGTLVAGWGGVIERLRVSKSARYAADYEPPLEYAVDADALAVYRFDEGRGATLNDASGNGHHGTIVKATWVDTTKPATDR